MVAPVTGPFTRHRSTVGPSPPFATYYTMTDDQRWFKQAKPYNLDLEYNRDLKMIMRNYDPTGNNPRDASGAPEFHSGDYTDCYNQALQKFSEKLGEASQWAVNYKERKQSMDLVTESLQTLYRFGRHLKRLDFVRAANQLKVEIPKGLKENSKFFSNNWLKFHFGVEPLMQDVRNGLETLSHIPRPKKVKAGKRIRVTGSYPLSPYPYGHADTFSRETVVKIMANVRVSDPDAYRANKLGFVNPASFAWEVIPFSFVVDWFVNVGDYLSSFTDFVGLEITNPLHSVHQVQDYTVAWYYGQVTDYFASYTRRALSIPGPTLKVRPWKAVSPVRGATAISLLIQQLKLR